MTNRTGQAAATAAHPVFAGLVPNHPALDELDTAQHHSGPGRIAKGVFATIPILLVGSMAAMTLNLVGPAEQANAKPMKPRGTASELGKSLRDALSVANTAVRTVAASTRNAVAPASGLYTVTAGDSISDIAGRYGLATASVLALNGLSWSSLIFPGQQLKLTNGSAAVLIAETRADPSPSGRYTIVSGDTISAVAHRFGVSTISVLSANGLGWASIIYPGQTIAIPGLIGPGTPAPSTDIPEPAADYPDDAALVSNVQHDDQPIVSPLPDVAPVVTPPPAAPPVAAPVPAPAPVPTGSYTIVSGDTLSGIATKSGVSTQALLDANGLDRSSVIYTGHTLVIPGGSTPAASGGNYTILTDEMRSNATVIVQVGRSLGVPDYGIVIALAAAMQESSLRNINWGDRDSVGLFQQRPSSGWGSVDQLTTPDHAARLFYGGRSNPNAGYTRGLLDIAGWPTMTVTQAAQAVQISGYPDAYARWETSARAWLSQLS